MPCDTNKHTHVHRTSALRGGKSALSAAGAAGPQAFTALLGATVKTAPVVPIAAATAPVPHQTGITLGTYLLSYFLTGLEPLI
jgi:hypothetical protein